MTTKKHILLIPYTKSLISVYAKKKPLASKISKIASMTKMHNSNVRRFQVKKGE